MIVTKNLKAILKIKKKKFNNEMEKEFENIEKEIQELKKTSLANISKIAAETSSEVIKQIIGTEINKSNVSAIVNDILKRNINKHI